jgi:uncharacterized protein YqiB (DUF1249 family)
MNYSTSDVHIDQPLTHPVFPEISDRYHYCVRGESVFSSVVRRLNDVFEYENNDRNTQFDHRNK